MEHFVLRSPGFALESLEALRSPAAGAEVARLVAGEARLLELRDEFSERLLTMLCDREQAAGAGRETFRRLYGIARSVRRDELVERPAHADLSHRHPELEAFLTAWQDARELRDGARTAAERSFGEALEAAREALCRTAAEPRFREALWMLNPNMLETGLRSFDRHWDPARRPSKVRQLERRLYAYLQRLCAKNETIGFFGPLNYGRFTAEAGASYRRSAEPIRRRRVFFAYWAAEALAASIAAEPSVREHLRPRRDQVRAPDGNLDRRLRRVHARSDGRLSVAAIAGELQRPAADVLADAERLAEMGLLRVALPIAPAALDPLAHVASFVRDLPETCAARERWMAALEQLDDERARFAELDLGGRRRVLDHLERRFEELTAKSPRRAAGRMFEDRGLLYEECLGDLENLQLGPEHARRVLDAVRPMAALSAAAAELHRQALESAAEALLRELSPAGDSVPFVAFLAAWRRRHPQPPRAPEAERLAARLAALVAERSDGAVSRLTGADLAALCPPRSLAVVCSPDVMLAAPSVEALAAGDYSVVLGELHHGAQASGWMLCFADEDWHAGLVRALPSPNDETPANLLLARRMKTAPPEFPGPSVAASAISERGEELELATLSVEIADGRLHVLAADGRRLRFYPPCYHVPDALYAPFAAFSYPLVRDVPVRLGQHTPRIEVDGAVYQRERWDAPPAVVPRLASASSDFELFHAVWAVKERLGWPDRVFVRTPDEPKPVYIDFHNPVAVELLAQVAGQAHGDLAVTEMWPCPDHLWLRGEHGAYPCELRLVLSAREEEPRAR